MSPARVLPIYCPQLPNCSDPAPVDAPPRLKSPFQLSSTPARQVVQSTARKSTRRPSRAPRCRHHCTRVDCPIQSASSHPFDSLPWIAAVELPPDNLSLYDIADLSQLPVDPVDELMSRAGPVRRRKTSFRRSPFSGSSPQHTSTGMLPPFFNRPIQSPCTPSSRASHSRIAFHDLMPILPCDAHRFRSANPSSPDY